MYTACVQGSTYGTNGLSISFNVLPVVQLVIPLVPIVLPNGTIGSPSGNIGTIGKPMVPLVSQWHHWLPMVPLVKLPMVPLGEPRMGELSFPRYGSAIMQLEYMQSGFYLSIYLLILRHTHY